MIHRFAKDVEGKCEEACVQAVTAAFKYLKKVIDDPDCAIVNQRVDAAVVLVTFYGAALASTLPDEEE